MSDALIINAVFRPVFEYPDGVEVSYQGPPYGFWWFDDDMLVGNVETDDFEGLYTPWEVGLDDDDIERITHMIEAAAEQERMRKCLRWRYGTPEPKSIRDYWISE